ncbi:hypothetical protein M422DRAFT_261108 [Sphaerobolus stellatus SS14]|uniref:Unplaced genomic scaffold SPHSTscaffold_102, whole genome shotgun sequence n=1 Tax=Sphaerobolus stellatus (strain SS14) TaxID=990650 RepID=A0A0C9U194_SPHS4|nr:hypothetical protein M422DRAFT_261108 [Sphaerobolus stellatus SS14]
MLSKFYPKQTKSSKPSHHANETATSFLNPWSRSKGLLASGQVFNNFKFPFEWAKTLHDHPGELSVVRKPNFGRDIEGNSSIKGTWLGHAGFMVELCQVEHKTPLRIIFDPIWSDRASPSQYAGPKRRLPPPCSLEELPEFHFVVTSHNHYDHLDWPTIEKMYQLRGSKVHFLVPLGNKQWFCDGGIPAVQITEMDWWDEIDLSRPGEDNTSANEPEVRFVCTPAMHGSGRNVHDQRATLWASWVVQQTVGDKTVSVYHAGDTGYMTESGPCPVFKEIGDKYGPFDLAMLPIWRGGSLSFIASMGLRLVNTELTDGLHASPAHAIAMHKDIKSHHSIGMHFATFAGSDVEAFEPIVELEVAKDKENDKRQTTQGEEAEVVGDWNIEGGFGIIDIGETAIIPVTDEAKERMNGKGLGTYEG